MNTRRQLIRGASALATTLLLPSVRAAGDSIPVAKMLCGFPPGGPSDAIGRRVAERLQAAGYASAVVVENRAGAGGQLAISALKDGATDGSVMLITPSAPLSMYPFTYSKLPYTTSDVLPVSTCCHFHHGLAVGPLVPESVRTLDDFVRWCRSNPDQATYGSPAAGSTPHLIPLLMAKHAKLELRHIPYRGTAPGLQDLLGGQVAAFSSPVGDFLPYVKTGKLRLLASSGSERNRFTPQVPTYKEQGYPVVVSEWYGIFLPAKTDASKALRLAAYLQPALSSPELVASLAQIGMEARSSTPADLAAQLRADAADWKKLIATIGFSMNS